MSWNIGGKTVESAVAAIEYSTEERGDQAVIAFQELPRVAAGWQTSKHEGMTLVQYRDDDQWRGNGIMFPAATYACLRRRANSIGVWLRLRHLDTGVQMWVCSARLSTGVSDARTAEEAHDILALRRSSLTSTRS